MRNRPAYGQNSVDNALLLVHILRDQGVVTVSQAADLLGVARSTAHRLLAMLVYRDFAMENEDHKYLPGPALYVSALEHRPTGLYNTLLRPTMNEICAHTGETVHAVVRTGRWVRFIATVESSQAIRVGDRRGVALPARRTAAGRAMLSDMPPAQLRSLYQAPGSDSEAQISNSAWQQLLRDMESTRHRGYAVNQEDTESGLVAVGVGIRHEDGRMALALSLAAPSTRLCGARIGEIGGYLIEMTHAIRVPSATDTAAQFC